jgi:beta-glucosidase
MKTLFLLLLAFSLPALAGDKPSPQGNDEERIAGILQRMSLQEKIDLLAGTGFETRENTRLGIPSLRMTDGPQGVRWGASTAFPAGIALAATWNTALIERTGAAIATEVKAKGRHMLLAPCFNILRVPQGGRSFEGFGEDPHLAARAAVAYVKGVQSQRVIATVKHFAANNQENDRMTVSAGVDEQALREIHLPAFKAAVQEGGALSVMSAYNRLNNTYCSEHPWLLTDVLKKEWGFQGFVVSDWGATHSTVASANAGLDLEMPTGQYFNAALLEAVQKNQVTEATINDKVTRILRAMIWAGLFDAPAKADPSVVGNAEQRQAARAAAQEGIVLLKNEGNILPLDLRTVRSIALLGPNAPVARVGGGGSAYVEPTSASTPLQEIVARAGGSARIVYARGEFSDEDFQPVESRALRPASGGSGLKGEYFANPDCKGSPALIRVDPQVAFRWKGAGPAASLPKEGYSVRWTGSLLPPADGRYEIRVRTDDGVRLWLDNALLIDDWTHHAAKSQSTVISLKAGRPVALRMEYFNGSGEGVAQLVWRPDAERPLATAVEAARGADVALIFAGNSHETESEGFDRPSLELPAGQNDLIEAVLRVNRNVVVVLNVGSPVVMSRWVNRVPGLLCAWFPGQEGAAAVAEVLFGEVNPSGKLPVTFPKRWEDCAVYGNYPGSAGVVNYKEGIFVGYRHVDARNLQPEFPFGFGLSYSTFVYRNLVVNPGAAGRPVTVTLELENTSRREGAEVVQLYLRDAESSVPRPARELKAFKKVSLRPGQKMQVSFEVTREECAFFHPLKKSWVVEPGKFEVQLGSSSRDIRLRGEFSLQ